MNSFDWKITRVETCPSTNVELLKRLENSRATSGDVLVARTQTAGRGRLDRTWTSPPGSLTFSVALANPLPPDKIYQLNLAAGLALAEAVDATASAGAQIKWPNDVLLNGLKAAGILSEAAANGHLAVIGIGLNLNSRAADFPEGLRGEVATLHDVTGKVWPEAEVLDVFLGFLKKETSDLGRTGLAGLLPRLNERLAFKGENVRVTEASSAPYEGILRDIDLNGFLRVQPPSGELRHVIAGDVRPRR